MLTVVAANVIPPVLMVILAKKKGSVFKKLITKNINHYMSSMSPCPTMLTHYIMDYPMHNDTMSMGLPIVYFKGPQVEFSKL